MKRVIISLLLLASIVGCSATANCPEQRQLSAAARLPDAGDTLMVLLSVNLVEVRGGDQQVTLNINGLPADSLFADVSGLRIMSLADTATVYYTVPVGPAAGGTCCATWSIPEGTIPTDAFTSGQLQVTFVTNVPGLRFPPKKLNPTVIGLWTKPC